MRRVARGLAPSIALVVVALWATTAGAVLNVVATTTDVAAIATAVGGDDARVEALTAGTSDPHYVAARPSMIRRAFDADLLIVNGAELEVGWLPALLQSARNGRILEGAPGHLDLSLVVTLRDVPTGPVSRAMGDVHASGNPHFTLDPRNGAPMARAIAERMARLDPANASRYEARRQAFEADLLRGIARWTAALSDLAGRPVLVYHRTFDYFAAAFGMRIAGALEPLPGIAPTVAHLATIATLAKDQRIDLLMQEGFFERRTARALHQATGIKVAVLPHAVGARPEIETYVGLFDAMVKAIREAGAP